MAGKVPLGAVAGVVGFLVIVEFTSGILQGYYTPILTDVARFLKIHDADVNWFEGSQLMLSALVVPALAKLGDMFGHKRILLISTALTAFASIGLAFAPTFALFLVAWALQGFYVVWLPLEVALIFSRSRAGANAAALTRKAAGFLVAGLELGAIVGALSGGAISDAVFGDRDGLSPAAAHAAVAPGMWIVLIVPALFVVACFFVILFGVKESPDQTGGTLDYVGLVIVSMALLVLTAGLSFMRVTGPGDWLPWTAIALGLALFVPFVRWELRQADPLIDIRMLAQKSMWPVQVTALLFGVSVLGAQAPLATFAGTDPEANGYGLGVHGFTVSLLIGFYVISLIIGAMLFPVVTRVIAPRRALMGAAALVAIGYLALVPFHGSYLEVLSAMIIAGIGSGALVAALPSAAAAVAPVGQTGVATGLTNTTKTIGGAFASCVFGLALIGQVTSTATNETVGSLPGYITVWMICGLTAVVATILLAFVPKRAFEDSPDPVVAEVR
jgi:MFS family permease